MKNKYQLVQKMNNELFNTEMKMIYPIKFRLDKKIKYFFSNTIIFISIILLIIIVISFYEIYIRYNTLIPISALIGTSFLTLLLVIIRDSYSTMNKKDKILLSFTNELHRNWINVKANSNKILTEIEYINTNKIIFDPLFTIQFDVYKLMVQSFPEEIIKLGLNEIEDYVLRSHEINELLTFRENIPKKRHYFKLDTYTHLNLLNALKTNDEIIINRSKKLLESIIRLLEKNGRIIKIEGIEEVKNLTNPKYLERFLEQNKLKKGMITEDNIKKSYERNISTIYILILNSLER